MKKILFCGLCLFALLLGGCTGIKTSENGDKQQQEIMPPAAASTAAQIEKLCAEATVADQIATNQKAIELTPEIKGLFFDLAQQERWDFLPVFGIDGAERPNEMSDYIYLVIAQSLVWQDYYNIDHELTPEKLSTEYVDAFLSARFGQPIPHPAPNTIRDGGYKGIDFDGEYYTSGTEWSYPPLYGLSLLIIDDSNPHTTVYDARFLGYSPNDSVPDNAREIICSLDEAKPGFTATYQLHVRFYFAENGVPVYLAVEN